ncbi:MAG: terminase small subunit [Clostridia bacterium]|nr:terminase small subunit [Clostridia bacterium]
MTQKQREFCKEYVKTMNVTQSAIKAGFSEAYSKSKAYRLLDNEEIKAYIEKLTDSMIKKDIADANEISKYLTRVLRGKEKESVVVVSKWDGVQTVKKSVGAKERIRAAELLGKMYAMFTDNIDISDSKVVIVDDIDNTKEE